jgi:general secretion pathway protein A
LPSTNGWVRFRRAARRFTRSSTASTVSAFSALIRQFLYLSESHEEAIRLLLQAIQRNEAFIVLTGDTGTGKTTLSRALMGQLDATTFTSLILNPFLSVDDLLREVLLDFGIVSRDDVRTGRVASATTHELTRALHEFLSSLVPLGARPLIIDEAQHLSPDVRAFA